MYTLCIGEPRLRIANLAVVNSSRPFLATAMKLTAIPYLLMRGGSSRGPFFNQADLPADETPLSEVLLAVFGSGHPLDIDGIGGGNAVTT